MSRPRILLVLAAVIGLIAGVLLLLMPRHAYAECRGCQQHDDINNVVCTSQCSSEGYRITVLKQIQGGPSLPSECSMHGVSASGQYILLERIPKIRIYGQVEYPGIAQNPNFTVYKTVQHTVGPNDQVCDVHGNPIYNGNYYEVTLGLLQGNVACYPAREDTIDCGSYNTMALRYDNHAQTPIPNRLQPCGDDCSEVIQGGSGGTPWIGSLGPGGVAHAVHCGNPNLTAENEFNCDGDATPVTSTHPHISTMGKATPTATTTHTTGGPVGSTSTVDTERQACLRKGGTASMTTGKIVCIIPQPKTPHPGTPGTKGTPIPQGTPGKRY